MKKSLYTNKAVWFIFLSSIYSMSFAQSIKDVQQMSDIQFNQRPFVIEFYRPSCPHCLMMIPRYEQAARNNTKGVLFYRVNADNIAFAMEVATKLCTPNHKVAISGVPYFVFVDKVGNVSEMSGQMATDALENKIAKLN